MKSKDRFIILLVLLCIGSLFSGCEREEALKISMEEVETQAVQPPEEEGLRIAVSAIVSPKKTFIYYREMLDYVSEKLDVPVELVQRETYAEVNELIRQEKINAAFVCSGAYIVGHEQFAMELLVAPKAYGEPYYYSYIIVPEDSDAGDLEDLKDKKFAFTDPMSNTGKLAPTYMLAGIGETPESFFSGYIFTYSHDKSIEAVARKLVDGASVDSLIWDYANAANPEFTSKTKIISKSPPFGIPPVVVPTGLAPELKEKLRQVFLNMHLEPKGRTILANVKIDRFITIEDSAYDSIREMKTLLERQDEGNK